MYSLKSFWTTPVLLTRFPRTQGTASSPETVLCSRAICLTRSSFDGGIPCHAKRNPMTTAPGYHITRWKPWPVSCSWRYRHFSRARKDSGSLRSGKHNGRPNSRNSHNTRREHLKRCSRLSVFSITGFAPNWPCVLPPSHPEDVQQGRWDSFHDKFPSSWQIPLTRHAMLHPQRQ